MLPQPDVTVIRRSSPHEVGEGKRASTPRRAGTDSPAAYESPRSGAGPCISL